MAAAPDRPRRRGRLSAASVRLVVAVLGGGVTAVVAVPILGVVRGLVLGWIVTSGTLLAWTWLVVGPLDAAQTESHAAREDEARPVRDAVMLVAAVVSLLTVATVLLGNTTAQGRTVDVVLCLGAVVLSWGLVHTVFALRYARLYYGGAGANGGIDFNQDAPPAYRDFAYVAFTLGMTFQVSDTTLTTTAVRSTALRHALISYVFGTVVIAVTVNVIAGIGR